MIAHPINLAVIIVNWRNEEDTLRSAAAVRDWNSLKPKLIVVDNESTEGSRKALASTLDVRDLISSEINLGYGGGNNLGITRALAGNAKYVLLLNSDADISEAGVTRLVDRLEANPEISILGPVIHEQQHGGVICVIGGRDIALSRSTRIAADPNALAEVPGYPLNHVDYVPGAVFLARRTLFEEIGLLDEQFFFSGEIADLCKRARDKRHRLCVDLEVEAHHDTGRQPQQVRETLYAYYSVRNRILYARKHYPDRRVRHFSFWAMTSGLEIAKALAKRKRAKARAIFLALAHAYANRSGNQNAAFM